MSGTPLSSLKDSLKSTSTKTSSSQKNPSYYAALKKAFIQEMSVDAVDPIVRLASANSVNIPATSLKQMLEGEQDNDVMRALLLNDRTPLAAIEIFADTSRANHFQDDAEIQTHLRDRVNGLDSAPLTE